MDRQRLVLIASVVLGLGYGWLRGAHVAWLPAASAAPATRQTEVDQVPEKHRASALFAVGCFWSGEAAFEPLPGVIEVTAGFTGGQVEHPTYAQVSAGGTGHAETVEVTFDARRISYAELLNRFWRVIDPFVAHRQFCDIGDEYRPEIFVRDDLQRRQAEASRVAIEGRFGRSVLVRISDAGPFYPAEAYHQDYYRTHAAQYRYYRWSCGRDDRIAEIWR